MDWYQSKLALDPADHIDLKSFIRELIFNHTLNNKEPIGRNVQIDESHLVKRRHNVGSTPCHFDTRRGGGIDSDGKLFFKKTKVRDKSTPEDIIRRNVIPGSYIVTGERLGYNV